MISNAGLISGCLCAQTLAHFYRGGKYPAPYRSQHQSYFCPPHTAGPWAHLLLCHSPLPIPFWIAARPVSLLWRSDPQYRGQRTTNQVSSSFANFGSWGTLFYLLVPMRHVWQGVPSSCPPHCLCSSFYRLSIFFANYLRSIFLLNLLSIIFLYLSSFSPFWMKPPFLLSITGSHWKRNLSLLKVEDNLLIYFLHLPYCSLYSRVQG